MERRVTSSWRCTLNCHLYQRGGEQHTYSPWQKGCCRLRELAQFVQCGKVQIILLFNSIHVFNWILAARPATSRNIAHMISSRIVKYGSLHMFSYQCLAEDAWCIACTASIPPLWYVLPPRSMYCPQKLLKGPGRAERAGIQDSIPDSPATRTMWWIIAFKGGEGIDDTGPPACSDSAGMAKKCHCSRSVTLSDGFKYKTTKYLSL